MCMHTVAQDIKRRIQCCHTTYRVKACIVPCITVTPTTRNQQIKLVTVAQFLQQFTSYCKK